MVMTLNLNAQIVLDDFSTGSMKQINVSAAGEQKHDQSGTKILDSNRRLTLKIKENSDKQLFQCKIKSGRLIASMGYGITGVVELIYGHESNKKLDLDLSSKRNINIEYEAKSNFGRVYVSMFSNGPNRAYWRGGGKAYEVFQGSVTPNGRTKSFVLKIPLSEFQSAQDNANVTNKFTMKDVDVFKIQFLSQGKQGLNFAVNKIWIE